MRVIFLLLISLLLFTQPVYILWAQTGGEETLETLTQKITSEIIRPFARLLILIAFVMFVWGIVQYLRAATSGSEEKMRNSKLILVWGIIGLAVIFGVTGIIKAICLSFNVACELDIIKSIF